MLKSKIIIGIIVAIAIIIGIGYLTTIENSNSFDLGENSQLSEQITDDSEGEKFTLKLDDTISAVGP